MARSLVLGNGNLALTMDHHGQVRDLFYPYVGQDNHLSESNLHRLGVWVDGNFSWLKDPDWQTHIECSTKSLAGTLTKLNSSLGIKITFFDSVYNEKDIFIRRVSIENIGSDMKEVKLFFAHEFEIKESHRGDTAYFDPHHHTIIHYKGRRVFLINAHHKDQPFDQYTTGVYHLDGKEGSFRDAEDGILSANNIEHGPTDSVIGVTVSVPPKGKEIIHYWLCAAKSLDEAHNLNSYIIKKGPDHLLRTTKDYWNAWLGKYEFNFHGLADNLVHLFQKSLLYIKTHADNRGAIIASLDTSMLQHGKDTYAYMWPRDAAFSVLALIRAGDHNAARRFFLLCNNLISSHGYLLHKYLPDGSLGSSWHPWIRDGKAILPIQEDETASVLYALKLYYEYSKDLELIERVYNSLIKNAADFLVKFRDPITGLPRPSHDLWEEKYGVHTYTVASIFAGLKAAAYFAEILGKEDHVHTYTSVAENIKTSLLKYCWDKEAGYFIKGIYYKDDGSTAADKTIDASSAYGIAVFGVLDADDDRLIEAFDATQATLMAPTKTKGLARYAGDQYYKKYSHLPGNPWIITSLWLAQHQAMIAKKEEDLEPVIAWLEWSEALALQSGVLPEQVNPETGDPVNATPLAWSHAEYVRTVFTYLDALERLGICQTCNPLH